MGRKSISNALVSVGVILLFVGGSMGSVTAQLPGPLPASPLDTIIDHAVETLQDDGVSPICAALGLGIGDCIPETVCTALGLPNDACQCIELENGAVTSPGCHPDPTAMPPSCTPGAAGVSHECTPAPHPLPPMPESLPTCGATTMADRSSWLQPAAGSATALLPQEPIPTRAEECCEGPYTTPPMLGYNLNWPVDAHISANSTPLIQGDTPLAVPSDPQVYVQINPIVAGVAGPQQVQSYINGSKYFLNPTTEPRAGESCGDPDPYEFEPIRNEMAAGGEAQQMCGCASGGDGVGAGGTISVLNGEFRFPLQAAVIPAARGLDFEFNLTYRSRSPVATAGDGLLGPDWDYTYGAYLRVLPTGDVMRHNGEGRADRYVATPPTLINQSADQRLNPWWTSPAPFYDTLIVNTTINGTFHILDRHGRTETYTQKSLVWPNAPSVANNATFLLTAIADHNGNEQRIWPYHADPGYGAMIDSHNRLFYWTKDGVSMYEGMELHDTEARIVNYTIQFNWTTASWMVWDHTDYRLSRYKPHEDLSGFNDAAGDRPRYKWDYGKHTWDWSCQWSEIVHNYTTTTDMCWHGKGREDDDGHTDPPYWEPGDPGHEEDDWEDWHRVWHRAGQGPGGSWAGWPEDYDNDTLDNEPNCIVVPYWECRPDDNYNWTMLLRPLANFTFTGSRLTAVSLPTGESTSFTYQGGKMASVSNGFGQEYLHNWYDAYGRMYMQRHGYGFWTFGYNTIDGFTRVQDRNGNIVDYYGRTTISPLVWKSVEWTNRDMNPEEPDFYVTTYAYNKNQELTRLRHPRGNLDYWIFDDTNARHASQGNLLCHIEDPGPYTTGLDGEPQYPQITRWTYDVELNRPASMQDAREEYPGFIPPNGGNVTLGRYTTNYAYDSNGNLLRITYPDAQIPVLNEGEHNGTYTPQERFESWDYNEYGQIENYTDVMGKTDNWTYYPANLTSNLHWSFTNGTGSFREMVPDANNLSAPDPHLNIFDGEGFIWNHTEDIYGFKLRTEYTRDAEGNPASITDGEGNTYTLEYSHGCKLGKVTSPAPFYYNTTIKYDKNGRPNNVTRQVDDNRTTYEHTVYDLLGHPLKEVKDARRPQEAPHTSQDITPTTYYCYDLNENLILERRPESVNRNQYWDLVTTVYDERDLVISITRGNMTEAFFSQPRSPAAGGCLQDIDDEGAFQAWNGTSATAFATLGFSTMASTGLQNVETWTGPYQVHGGGVGLWDQLEGFITLSNGFGGPMANVQPERAYMYWQVLDVAPHPDHEIVHFGVPGGPVTVIQGQMVANEAFPCWNAPYEVFAYRADVTDLISGPGPYHVEFTVGTQGFHDPWQAAAPVPGGWPPPAVPALEGASIVAIAPFAAANEITLTEHFDVLNYDLINGTGDRLTTNIWLNHPINNQAQLWLVGGDGQSEGQGGDGGWGHAPLWGSATYWNGPGFTGTFDGSDPHLSTPDYIYGNLWDTDAAFVTAYHGWNQLEIESLGDCLAPQVSVLSTPLLPASQTGTSGTGTSGPQPTYPSPTPAPSPTTQPVPPGGVGGPGFPIGTPPPPPPSGSGGSGGGATGPPGSGGSGGSGGGTPVATAGPVVVAVGNGSSVGGSLPFVVTPGNSTQSPKQTGKAPVDPPDTESTVNKTYDANRNLIGERDGNGYWTRYEYDGYDRQIVRIDAMDGRLEMKYDPVANLVLERFCGYPTPGARGTGGTPGSEYEQHCRTTPPEPISADVILSGIVAPDVYGCLEPHVEKIPPVQLPGLFLAGQPTPLGQLYTLALHHHDEANREFLTDNLILDSSTGRKLQDGPLTPDDSFASSVTIYDKAGKVIQSFNDNGHAAATVYDSLGRVDRTIDAMDNIVTKRYDILGRSTGDTRVERFSDESQGPRIYDVHAEHDALGRRSETTDASGGKTRFDYNAVGRVKEVKNPLDFGVSHIYDNSSRTIVDLHDVYKYNALEPHANYTLIVPHATGTGSFTADSRNVTGVDAPDDLGVGMVVRSEDAFSGTNEIVDVVSSSKFDMDGDADTNGTFEFSYTPFIRELNGTYLDLVFTNDTVMRFSNITVDHNNATRTRIVGTYWEPVVRTYTINVTYDYDGDGRLVSQTDGLNQTTTYKYDSLGRKVRETAPDGSWMEFMYDAEDQVIWFKDPNGNEVNTTHDPLGRVVQIRVTGLGNHTVGTTEQIFVLDALGRRIKQWDMSNDPKDAMYVSRTYDSLGRILVETQNWQTSTSTYDGLNRVTYNYPDGRQLRYFYDDLERLIQLRSAYPKADSYPPFVPEGTQQDLDEEEILVNYTYVGPSRLHSRVYDQGTINQTLDYDTGGRLSEMTYRNETDVLRVGFEYRYDAASRLVDKAKLHGGWSESYTMDGVGRLTKFERPGGLADVDEQSWELDDANNWINTTKTTAISTATEERNHNKNNELTQMGAASLIYDENGNLNETPEFHYKWDFKNRLRQVWTNGTDSDLVAEYWYDSENRRTRKEVGHVPTLYFLDAWNEVQESDCFGVISRQYVYGDGVDELILVDRPIVESKTLTESCALISGGGASQVVPAAEECIDVDVDANDPSASGTCSAVSWNIGPEGFSVDSMVCVSEAWLLLDREEPSPVSGCFECPAGTKAAAAAAILVKSYGGCHPCNPRMEGIVHVESNTQVWAGEASLDTGCNPCPAPDQTTWIGIDSSFTPTFGPVNTEQEECVTIDIDARRWFLQDEQRSVYALTNNTGVVLEGYEYDPYGRVLVLRPGVEDFVTFSAGDAERDADDATSMYLYTGRRYDAETGLMQYRTRYYDTEMGRFISKDTIGVWGDPNSLGNAYAYCVSSVHVCTDPLGEGWFKKKKSVSTSTLKQFVDDVAKINKRFQEFDFPGNEPCISIFKKILGHWQSDSGVRHRVMQMVDNGFKENKGRDHAKGLENRYEPMKDRMKQYSRDPNNCGGLNGIDSATESLVAAAAALYRDVQDGKISPAGWVALAVIAVLVGVVLVALSPVIAGVTLGAVAAGGAVAG